MNPSRSANKKPQDAPPPQNVNVNDNASEEEEESEEEEDEDDDEEGDEEDMGPNSLMFGDMLDSILARHFEYSQDDNTLSLAEILLLIKQSIDSQNSILSELLKLKISKYGGSNSGSGHHRSSSSVVSSSSARQETPEERAIRKQKEAAARGRA